jgi:hypothetical protein
MRGPWRSGDGASGIVFTSLLRREHSKSGKPGDRPDRRETARKVRPENRETGRKVTGAYGKPRAPEVADRKGILRDRRADCDQRVARPALPGDREGLSGNGEVAVGGLRASPRSGPRTEATADRTPMASAKGTSKLGPRPDSAYRTSCIPGKAF